ncbi:CAAX protease [Psychrobacter frigidicola]|uniref:CAAX protease n=1 Tax=Psychrobacter frigidicola TaxID=45611 RepID=A0A5C6ZZW3_9GAMM|nr:Abi family protein [Psychrobacter frigidicola]TXD96523.1 CAAX protease [Psychrobacter frigidicola]
MVNKKPIKEWTSFSQQLELLKKRGLIVENEQKALGYLKTIGYYRLSGYLYSFRQFDPNNTSNKLDNFIEGSHFEDVKNLYMFDKKLRQLALDGLERIEVALRVNISYSLGRYSPIAYLDSQYFDENFNHSEWLTRHIDAIKNEQRKKNTFVNHHTRHYAALPVWVSCETWDFGTMSTLFKGMKESDKDKIAKIYHLQSGSHLQSHLHAFNFIRNVSAHHSRLWNKAMVFKASLKGLSDDEWQALSVKKVFVYFCLMKRMLDVICPNSKWGERFLALLDEFPKVGNNSVYLEQMGVNVDPDSWQLWQGD